LGKEKTDKRCRPENRGKNATEKGRKNNSPEKAKKNGEKQLLGKGMIKTGGKWGKRGFWGGWG